MKITKFEGTSSYIKVTINDNRIVKIQGEFLVGGFCAYRDTINHWEPPYDDVVMDDKIKDEQKNPHKKPTVLALLTPYDR
ncbi:Imm74 family immunity protein [Mesobacillus maritimus]|uniref:Uncharacterized protein n=1 Tax=Mesobacillus maritimus TaxID=1643336 RepID=A0ABS7K770_9BACI|nr:Imm74 family immunity protein [Mesobacillus maritimus]MBY0097951.1 hypothetical protein [Mesobacillus maritimus]